MKNPFNRHKYWFVSYAYEIPNGFAQGNATFKNKTFVNVSEIADYIISDNSKAKNVIITNIIQLTRKQFEYYRKTFIKVFSEYC